MAKGLSEAFPHGWKTMADGSRVPLTSEEAQSLAEIIDRHRAEIEAKYPDEKTTLGALTDAFHRLRDFGWRGAIYCPKDGSSFEVIEAGSSGIHRCHYSGEWPNGSWWIEEDDGDLSPSRPILFRLFPEDEAKRKERMKAAADSFRAGRALLENKGE